MKVVSRISQVLKESATLGEQYSKKELEHFQIKVFYKLALHTSGTAKKVIIGTLLILASTFCAIALALYLGELFSSDALGFLAVGGLYLILLLTAYLGRRRIEKQIINELAQTFLN